MAVAALVPGQIETRDALVAVARSAPHINLLVESCHALSVNAGWYQDPKTKEMIERNVPEMLALIHSEISEALEGVRKNKADDHLPDRPSVEVELADACIRIFDLAACLKLDLGGAVAEKVHYNSRRADHTLAARAADDGKKF